MTSQELRVVLNAQKRKTKTRAPHAETNAHLSTLKAVKGHYFVLKFYRLMPLGQIAALVIVNVFLKINHSSDFPVVNTHAKL